jgi:hypothetical protein
MSSIAKTPNGVDPTAAAVADTAAPAAALRASRVALIANAREAKARKAALAGAASPGAIATAAVDAVAEESLSDTDKAKLKKARAKEAKAKKEARPPLPEETKPAPTIPAQAKTVPLYDEDLAVDDADLGELSSEVPVNYLKVQSRLPKQKYLQVMSLPAPESVKHQMFYAIRLGEEDRRPGQIDTFILARDVVAYFRNELEQPVTLMIARVFTLLQGQPRFFVHPAASELSGNSWSTSRRELIRAAETRWVMPVSIVEEGRYGWRERSPELAPVAPNYPTEPFIRSAEDGSSLFKRSLIHTGALIADRNHRICKRLRGEEEDEYKGVSGV